MEKRSENKMEKYMEIDRKMNSKIGARKLVKVRVSRDLFWYPKSSLGGHRREPGGSLEPSEALRIETEKNIEFSRPPGDDSELILEPWRYPKIGQKSNMFAWFSNFSRNRVAFRLRQAPGDPSGTIFYMILDRFLETCLVNIWSLS